MKTNLLILLFVCFLPNVLLSQDKVSSKAEIEDMVNSYISHFQDSVVVKGRLLRPIYRRSDPPITPQEDCTISVSSLNPYRPHSDILQLRSGTFTSGRSDENGEFNIKLPRGRYIFNLYHEGLATRDLLVNVVVGDEEIKSGCINIGEIRLDPNVVKIRYSETERAWEKSIKKEERAIRKSERPERRRRRQEIRKSH